MRRSPQRKPSPRIGTSGWSYPHWQGVFYPPKLNQREWLEFYSQHFDTVEINSSFYHLPSEKVFERWQNRTPGNFRFAVKASRFITHRKRLADAEEPLQRFLNNCQGLGKKLGCLLFQLPPQLHLDLDRLNRFLRLLPERPPCAFEFRHDSWFCEQVYQALEERGIALCRSSSDRFPDAQVTTAPFVYIRMHGGTALYSSKYSDQELKKWAGEIRQYLKQGKEVWVYFNNDAQGYAVTNARTLTALLCR